MRYIKQPGVVVSAVVGAVNPVVFPMTNPNFNPNPRALTIAFGTRDALFGPPTFHLPWLLIGRAPFWARGRFARRS